ncbi:MAG: hypothetical protein ACK59C_06265, partial [Holosporales bacterium]
LSLITLKEINIPKIFQNHFSPENLKNTEVFNKPNSEKLKIFTLAAREILNSATVQLHNQILSLEDFLNQNKEPAFVVRNSSFAFRHPEIDPQALQAAFNAAVSCYHCQEMDLHGVRRTMLKRTFDLTYHQDYVNKLPLVTKAVISIAGLNISETDTTTTVKDKSNNSEFSHIIQDYDDLVIIEEQHIKHGRSTQDMGCYSYREVCHFASAWKEPESR